MCHISKLGPLDFFNNASEKWRKTLKVHIQCQCWFNSFLGMDLYNSLPGNINKGLFSSLSVELANMEALTASSAAVPTVGWDEVVGAVTSARVPNEKPLILLRKTIT